MIFFAVIAAALVGGFLYALVTHLLIFIISRVSGSSRLKTFIDRKTRSFLILYIFFFLLIASLAFNRLENKGYGDFEKMPVGNSYELVSVDGGLPLLENSPVTGYIADFTIHNKVLYARVQTDAVTPDKYIIFNTGDASLTAFASRMEYEDYARQNDLPLPDRFTSFSAQYAAYWSSRERWWLPF